MVTFKRLRLLTGVLGAAAACIAIVTTVIGDAPTGKSTPSKPVQPAAPLDGAALIDELARTKFSSKPTLVYKSTTGDTLFAWQVKPTLAASARPVDVLVMVDTSASPGW